MSERSANVIGGIFLMLFGLALLLTGGGCAALWVVVFLQGPPNASNLGLVLISLLVAALGVFAIVQAVKMLRRR
jgi:hypothetical protein